SLQDALPICVLDEFPEVDFGIEVGGEIAAVAARVHVDDVDRFDFVEVRVHGVAPVSVDDAGIEAGTQDGGDACCTAGIATLPLVVLVPRRRFAHFGGIFVDGS